MCAVVLLAINKYVLPGVVIDVSDALHRLIWRDLTPRLNAASDEQGGGGGASPIFEPNEFREEHMYTEAVDLVLRAHEKSLRALFSVISDVKRARTDPLPLLSLEGWRAFLRAVELLGADITERDAALCFSWSRMAVSERRTERGQRHESCLPFEGFLEALCRIAALKALPTDEEIANAGHAHAGTYMIELRTKPGGVFEEMLRTRSVGWGEEPVEPLARCVAHLLEILIYTVEAETQGADNLQVTAKEALLWAQAARLGPAVNSKR